MVEADNDAIGDDINALAADADETTRQHLAERLAPTLAHNLIDYPWLRDPAGRLSKSERITQQTFAAAIFELYDPAQRDVLDRAGILAHELLQAYCRSRRTRRPGQGSCNSLICRREVMPSLAKMLRRWASMVRGLRNS